MQCIQKKKKRKKFKKLFLASWQLHTYRLKVVAAHCLARPLKYLVSLLL